MFSRRADHRYLVGRLVDKLQGRAQLGMKKGDVSNDEHGCGMEQFLSYIQMKAGIRTHHEESVALKDVFADVDAHRARR